MSSTTLLLSAATRPNSTAPMAANVAARILSVDLRMANTPIANMTPTAMNSGTPSANGGDAMPADGGETAKKVAMPLTTHPAPAQSRNDNETCLPLAIIAVSYTHLRAHGRTPI